MIRYSIGGHIYPINGSPERKARKRRVELFMHVTGLRDVGIDSANWRPPIVQATGKQVILDKVSLWSTERALFCLNENYSPDSPKPGLLQFVEVPTPFAPYCGRYTSNPSDKPWTRSWLFCEPGNFAELMEIKRRLDLAAPTAPRWNTY